MVIKRRISPDAPATPIRYSTPAIQPSAAAAPVPPDVLEVEAAVQAIGFILTNNVKSYWLSDFDRRQTMTESFSVITTVLARKDRLRITVEDDNLKVNGEEHEVKTVHVREMVKHLSQSGSCNFTMEKGLTTEEFHGLMDLLSQPPPEENEPGDLTDRILAKNFQHVTSRHVILREVSEDEAVVSRKELEAASEEERKKVESDVLSLLGSEPAAVDSPEASERTDSLCRVMSDSQKMSDLIMRAAEQQQPGLASADPKQVSALVVQCLDKAFDALLGDPFSKTQKGKKTIAAALQKLEKELLSKIDLKDVPAEENPVTGAVERMTERLKMDSVVQDYTRKLKALEDSEKKILRFMKLQGLDRMEDSEFQRKLGEEGVDVSDWHRLLAISGAAAETGADESEAAAVAVAQLAAMLKRLESDVSTLTKETDPNAGERVTSDLEQVNTQVRNLAQKTQEKIAGLVDSIQADLSTEELVEQEAVNIGKPMKMTRRHMLVVLAEVVQELCQPLSVITCAADMLSSKALGELAQGQVDMIRLISESAARIQMLANSLDRIAAQPKTLHPDQEIQKALYESPPPAPAT